MAKQNKEYVYVDCYQCDENGKRQPVGSVNTWTTYRSGNTKKQRTLMFCHGPEIRK